MKNKYIALVIHHSSYAVRLIHSFIHSISNATTLHSRLWSSLSWSWPIQCFVASRRKDWTRYVCCSKENDTAEGADARSVHEPSFLLSQSLADLPASVIGHAQHSSVGGVLSRMTECGSAPSHEQRSRRTTGRGKLTLVWVWFMLFEDRGYAGLSNLYEQNVSRPSGSEWRCQNTTNDDAPRMCRYFWLQYCSILQHSIA